MTRINSAIPVYKLTDEHLLAEHREIKRIPNSILASSQQTLAKIHARAPKLFVLGPGHVLFFYNKLKFLYLRYLSIHNELISRGFSIDDYSKSFNAAKQSFPHLWNTYVPTAHEHELLVKRITDRILSSPKEEWHYRREKVSKKKAVSLLSA